MKFQFLGYGGAFDHEQGNSAAIISHEDYVILLDCGFTVLPELQRRQLTDKLTHVLITHLHFDHVGSLPTLLQYRKIMTARKLKLLYPDEKFRQTLFDFLDFGLKDPAKTTEFVPLSSLGFADHIDTHGKHIPGMQTYAYTFRGAEENYVFSGDLSDADFLMDELKKRDIDKAIVFIDTAFFNMGAHSYYKRNERYSGKYRMIGYHHNPGHKPVDCKMELVSECEEFLFRQ